MTDFKELVDKTVSGDSGAEIPAHERAEVVHFPPPTAYQLLQAAVTQLSIDCEADACSHKRRALDQARAAVKSLAQSAIEQIGAE